MDAELYCKAVIVTKFLKSLQEQKYKIQNKGKRKKIKSETKNLQATFMKIRTVISYLYDQSPDKFERDLSYLIICYNILLNLGLETQANSSCRS